MNAKIDPVRPAAADRRRMPRRRTDEATAAGQETTNLPMVIVGESARQEPSRPAPAAAAAGFAAHVMGQEGQKRGLRGGPPVLDKARSTYLGAEYSGPADRRPPPGAIRKAEI